MVAYSFHPRFCPPIVAGTKLHTIRADRRRHARPGEELQLYTGMRTKHCSLITRETCHEVGSIELDLVVGAFQFDGNWYSAPYDIDGFAVRDGFTNWLDLTAFWHAVHPRVDVFKGVLISWAPIPYRTFSNPREGE